MLRSTFTALDALGPPADRDTLLSFAGSGDDGLPAEALSRVRAIRAAYA